MHAGRPLQSFRDTGLRQDDLHLALAQEKPASFLREIGIHRQVGASSLENGDRPDHLFPALLHDERHQAVRASAQLPQAPRQTPGMSMHIFIGEPALPGRNGGVVGARAYLVEKRIVQQTLRKRTGGVVHHGALRHLRQWKQISLGLAPRRLVERESLQKGAVRSKHVVQQPGREQFFNRVPAQIKMSPALIDLVIEIHLRRLTHAIRDLPHAIR